ncbi:hypothetical protein PN499_11890 [Kamptonema animale CS-326]|jgi:hypothetical protein|uniref:HipA family kinase n=1 Tax=Kamptonema animale TaxID=92934 RepID=UPI00232F2C5D|nr:HipA family kinase [Kamptonema animale]MDB9511889.1 hypothetical protein [Kamptonema animale CS-326]
MGKSENTENTREYWKEQLNNALLKPEIPISAITFRKGWRTKAEPVLLKCNDGREYVVKGQQAGRQIVNDHITARLGFAIGAPVGEPKIVEVSAELIAIEPNLYHIPSGTAHATLYIPDCLDSWELMATSETENRSRFALLAVLYGWVYANDIQFIFHKTPPRLVFSVDHGHFFPSGPDWTEYDLIQAPQAELNSYLCENCNFTEDEISSALRALESVSEQTIIQAVAAPPNEWGLTLDERVTLVEYLTRQQQQLLTFFKRFLIEGGKSNGKQI